MSGDLWLGILPPPRQIACHPAYASSSVLISQDIDFNAADTEVVAALEALPNIGTVAVTRTGPNGQLGYSWLVTFLKNPGYFPAGSGDVSFLIPDCSGLLGHGATCLAEEKVSGSPQLSGVFVLAFTASADNGRVTRYTDELPYNALPEEVMGWNGSLFSFKLLDVS